MHSFALALLTVGAAASFAGAQFVHNEQTNGDFSDNRLAPTTLTAAAGDNFIFGIMGGTPGAPVIDLDYFAVVVPAGHQLDHIWLDFYDSPDSQAFIAVLQGSTFSIAPEDATPENMLGWVHFGPARLNTDLLAAMGANGIGFTPPLPAGTYSFWAQQLDDNTDWTARFEVSVVPAPATGAALGACGIVWMRSRRRA